MSKITNYNELYRFMETATEITEDEIAILRELDETRSVVTQASLNEILVGIYERLESESISIEGLGEQVDQPTFANWVDETFDSYTAGLFADSIG